jgi:hypothetical protein
MGITPPAFTVAAGGGGAVGVANGAIVAAGATEMAVGADIDSPDVAVGAAIDSPDVAVGAAIDSPDVAVGADIDSPDVSFAVAPQAMTNNRINSSRAVALVFLNRLVNITEASRPCNS